MPSVPLLIKWGYSMDLSRNTYFYIPFYMVKGLNYISIRAHFGLPPLLAIEAAKRQPNSQKGGNDRDE